MKTTIEKYEVSGEVDKYKVYIVECAECDASEEMPIDEQHWHTQHFDHIRTEGDNAHIYKCCVCRCTFKHEINEQAKEEAEAPKQKSLFQVDEGRKCGGCNYNDLILYAIATTKGEALRLYEADEVGLCSSCIVELIVSEGKLII